MKAVVIGGAGHVGNAIVRTLLACGHEVTVCGRRLRPPINLERLPIHYAPGDAENPGQFENWITGNGLVVDAAAPYPLSVFSPFSEGGSEPIFHAERRTRRLLDAVRRSDAVLAYVGSFVTLAQPRTAAERLRAQTLKLTHPYFEVKELIESLILDASRRGLRAVIVNPTYCLGPWDLRERGLCTIPLLLNGRITGSIDQMLNVIDVRDTAQAVIAAIDAKRYGEPLLLSGRDISTHTLYSLICELGGADGPKFSSNAPMTLAGAYWLELMFEMFNRKTPVPSGGMMMAMAFDYTPHLGELETLGVKPRPLAETIADAIAWYREIRYC